MTKKTKIFLATLALCAMAVPFAACADSDAEKETSEVTASTTAKDGVTPHIGTNGNWFIGDTDTNVKAAGTNGTTPTISINSDGYWVINGTVSTVKAQGTDGTDGVDGTTPTISINSDGYWVINGTATTVKAQGKDGIDGTTPAITIDPDGHWLINGNDTGILAVATDGEKGETGRTGFFVTSEAELRAAVKVDNSYLILLSNITMENSKIIYVRKNVILDFNGYTLTFSGSSGLKADTANGNLTLMDSTYTAPESGAKAKINVSATGQVITAQNSGTVTIVNGGYEKVESSNSFASIVATGNKSTLTINSGYFIGNEYVALSATANSIATVNGGVFTSTNNTIQVNGGAELTINNADVSCNCVITRDSSGHASGGKAALSVWKATDETVGGKVIVNGGTFKSTFQGLQSVDGGDLTVNNATVEVEDVSLYARNGSQLTVVNGNFTSKNNFIIGTNGSKDYAGSTITIDGGTFIGGIVNEGEIACGIYVANDDTVKVNAGTFNITDGVGIVMRSGDTTVSDQVVINITTTMIGEEGAKEQKIKSGTVGDSTVNIVIPKYLVRDSHSGYPGGEPIYNTNSTSTYEVFEITD